MYKFTTALLLWGGCSAAQDCKDPVNMHSPKCTVINAVLDCTKDEIPAVIVQFGPVVSGIIGENTSADGTLDVPNIEKRLASVGSAYGECILTDILGGVLAAPPKLSPGEVRPNSSTLKSLLSHARVTLWHRAETATVHTKYGDL